MSNSVKALLAVVTLVVVSAASLVVYTFPHWWYRVGAAEARSPLGWSEPVTIYKSTKGDLLFVIREDSLIDEYIFYPSTGQVGIPSVGQIHLFGVLAYSNDVPVSVVMSENWIKVETEMNIVVESGKLRFRTFHNL